METARSDLQQPILVTPAMSFKQSSRYDELRTKLRQLLVQMRNSRLCTSAQALLRDVCSSGNRPRRVKCAASALVSAGLTLTTTIADIMVRGVILFALLGSTVFMYGSLVIDRFGHVCYHSLWCILGQKGGIQREDRAMQREDSNNGLLQVQNHEMKAMKATFILNSEDVNFDEFEMRCSSHR